MNTKSVLACTAVVVAFALVVAPLAMSGDVFAFNFGSQSISQSNHASQSSTVVGGFNLLSGNNFLSQSNSNTGSNLLSQQ